MAGQCAQKGCASCGSINGCCQNDTCYPGTSLRACGAGGSTCKTCGSDQLCLAGLCKTLDKNECSLSSCFAGCCAVDGCHMPYNDQFCGLGGFGCVKCEGGKICSAGKCVSRTSDCKARCADGCCRGDVCVFPQNQGDIICGKNGDPCGACYGTQCIDGKCGGATLCPSCTGYNRCCAGGACQIISDQHCGRDGGPCVDCTNAGGCNTSTGQCNQQGSNRSMVCARELRVDCSETGGSPTCKPSEESEPDFQVTLILGSTQGSTAEANGTHDTQGTVAVTWQNDCPITNLTASTLSATALTIQIFEVDLFVSKKLVDSCQIQLTTAHINAGTWSGTCGNYVRSLILDLR